ncbi:uncharacterized protein TRAVEDRAFT_20460 [Trametes versicolor FP-101664 SS1]|uniref:uncharacterized protein n=1 Tax=Trametes versicolor (strain FP-101664) TaxID=717944 RepID=UPI00046222C7|nr:uncharacterized protein TRAVEDRAFT_20460 [Trametes versicolor FP-101664 SS1]EIW58455.1 hypothetical protein TRAVEDRAFT_20460 [Trametes versicolor FP-101664 SS1]
MATGDSRDKGRTPSAASEPSKRKNTSSGSKQLASSDVPPAQTTSSSSNDSSPSQPPPTQRSSTPDSGSVASSTTLPETRNTQDPQSVNPKPVRQVGSKTKRAPSPEWPTSPFGLDYPDELLDRVRNLSTMADAASNRYGLTRLPRSAKWGPRDDKLDDVLCNDGKPIVTFILGEVENASFFNELEQPQKFVRVAVKPMFHADVATGHRIIRSLAANVKKAEELQVGIIEAGRRQTRRVKSSRNTVPYEFARVYDASERYGPKSIMRKLSAKDIGYRDLVLVECKIVRFRADSETGKAQYFLTEWGSWRVRFDIHVIELLYPALPAPKQIDVIHRLSWYPCVLQRAALKRAPATSLDKTAYRPMPLLFTERPLRSRIMTRGKASVAHLWSDRVSTKDVEGYDTATLVYRHQVEVRVDPGYDQLPMVSATTALTDMSGQSTGSGFEDVTWRLYNSPRYGMSYIGRLHTNALAFSETVADLVIRVDYGYEVRIPWNIPRCPIKIRMKRIDEEGRGYAVILVVYVREAYGRWYLRTVRRTTRIISTSTSTNEGADSSVSGRDNA